MIQYIEKIFNDFHACTNIHIGLFDHTDKCLVRYPKIRNLPTKSSETKESVLHTLSLLYKDKSVTYITAPYKSEDKSLKNLYFTAGYIHATLGMEYAFVFGPYTISKEEKLNLPYIPLFADGHLVQLLHLITNQHISDTSQKVLSQNYHINRILGYMEKHYKENLTIGNIAKHFDMNISYLCRLFKEETGHTFGEHLNHYRIEKSKKLLKYSDYTFLEISQGIGFSSQSYFCRTFKKFTGSTPKEYRARVFELEKMGAEI